MHYDNIFCYSHCYYPSSMAAMDFYRKDSEQAGTNKVVGEGIHIWSTVGIPVVCCLNTNEHEAGLGY